jgi:hypothetical protein
MFFDLPDPDPSIIAKTVRKNLISNVKNVIMYLQ